ncbi:MAG: HAMP domain-containing sensor histidine kinase [Chloroflexota bacterium]|jgi:signal transduction histidine kinase
MLKTLRSRLILSHLLPSLIILPLTGILLTYAVETRLLLPAMTRELRGDALLWSEIVRDRPDIWRDPEAAQSVLDQAAGYLSARTMLLDERGRMLASTDPRDAGRVGSIPAALRDRSPEEFNQTLTVTYDSSRLDGEVIDVVVPVTNPAQERLGLVRVTYHYDTVYDQLFQFRFLLGAIMLVAMLATAGLGYVLASDINSPIQYVAQAIYDLAWGDRHEPLTLTGPEEIERQVKAVNFLLARLNSLEAARRQLLANLVHELGRPLGSLRSGLQALARGAKEDPELMDDLLTGMNQQAARLQVVLEDLAHLHDQILGTLELERRPLALGQWLPGVVRPWIEVAREKEQQVALDIPTDLPSVTADATRLAQAVENLISNAVKYTPDKGEITISAGVLGGEAWIDVADNGPGIPLEEQRAVFEPFFRGDQQQRIKQGMGLGLTIARDLVVAHGGRLELDSTLGEGSRFTIWIPLEVPGLETISQPATSS